MKTQVQEAKKEIVQLKDKLAMLQKLSDNQMSLLHDFEIAINKKETIIQQKNGEIQKMREEMAKLLEDHEI